MQDRPALPVEPLDEWPCEAPRRRCRKSRNLQNQWRDTMLSHKGLQCLLDSKLWPVRGGQQPGRLAQRPPQRLPRTTARSSESRARARGGHSVQRLTHCSALTCGFSPAELRTNGGAALHARKPSSAGPGGLDHLLRLDPVIARSRASPPETERSRMPQRSTDSSAAPLGTEYCGLPGAGRVPNSKVCFHLRPGPNERPATVELGRLCREVLGQGGRGESPDARSPSRAPFDGQDSVRRNPPPGGCGRAASAIQSWLLSPERTARSRGAGPAGAHLSGSEPGSDRGARGARNAAREYIMEPSTPDAQQPRNGAKEPARPLRQTVPFDRRTLEEVLGRALTLSGPAQEVLAADVEALREVARRHREESFSLEPVAVDLVESLLVAYFDGQRHAEGSAPSPWRPMSEQIARTLFEDSASSQRLSALWTRLQEATQ